MCSLESEEVPQGNIREWGGRDLNIYFRIVGI